MDRDAIKTSHEYQRLWEQHFSGGYFSDAVRETFDQIKDKTVEEKLGFYAQAFNEAHDLAKSIQSLLGAESIDLSQQGFGIINFRTDHESDEVMEEEGCGKNNGYRSLRVNAASFSPHIEGTLVYTHPESLEDNAQHIHTDAKHPPLWWRDDEEGVTIHLHNNGQIAEDGSLRHLDETILCALDAKETLEVVLDVIQEDPSIVATLGKTATENS